MDRARTALEMADRALDPIDPLRSGSSLPLALSLYRQAAYWTLLALRHGAEAGAALESVFAAAPAELLLEAAGSEAELARVRASLVERSFVDDAREQLEHLQPQVRAARAFVSALLSRADAARTIQHLLSQRRARIGAALLAILAPLLFAMSTGRILAGPDLALGRPWRASSTLMQCHPGRSECGQPMRFFFHTLEEKHPWLEIDLGRPTAIEEVVIENRKDCCADRAVPLVVEVSIDGSRFREVARRSEPFQRWRAQFEPVSARFVRLRVDRRSTLHLERVTVHGP